MFCLHICVLFYVCLWEKWANTGSFYKKGIGSFTRVTVIHSVCSISTIVFSILLFCVLFMLGSVQPKAKLCLFNECTCVSCENRTVFTKWKHEFHFVNMFRDLNICVLWIDAITFYVRSVCKPENCVLCCDKKMLL